MVADALAGDRMIGMVLLRPGWERDYEGRPPIYPIGCSGRDHALRAPERRPLQHRPAGAGAVPRSSTEDHERSYRRAVSSRWPSGARHAASATRFSAARAKLESLLAPAAAKLDGAASDPKIPASMSDEDLVNALAQYLDLEPLEKQALLERPPCAIAPCRSSSSSR